MGFLCFWIHKLKFIFMGLRLNFINILSGRTFFKISSETLRTSFIFYCTLGTLSQYSYIQNFLLVSTWFFRNNCGANEMEFLPSKRFKDHIACNVDVDFQSNLWVWHLYGFLKKSFAFKILFLDYIPFIAGNFSMRAFSMWKFVYFKLFSWIYTPFKKGCTKP